MKVNEIMAADVQSCCLHTSLDEIVSKMWEFNCSAIPVVDNDFRPVGIITDRDIAICCTLNHKAPWEIDASTAIANREIYICFEEDNIELALAMLKDRKVHRLPIVNIKGHLTGLLSMDGIIACFNQKVVDNNLTQHASKRTLRSIVMQQ